MKPLFTPDRRYVIVRNRLWRTANPHLAEEVRLALVHDLMMARRHVKAALQATDSGQLAAARQAVNSAKIALGERGNVWWTDGAPDFNRHLVTSTPYAAWYRDHQDTCSDRPSLTIGQDQR